MYFLVNDKKKFIVGWSAKCGCSAIKQWFIEVSGIETEKTLRHKVLGFGRTKWSNINKYSAEVYKNYKRFILVRDPYKRLVSGYVNKYVIEKAFSDDYQLHIFRNPAELIDEYRFDDKWKNFSIRADTSGIPKFIEDKD